VRKGIDRIAITDHNEIKGALEAKKLDPERVIVGEEIATTRGELLGYFMSEWIPPGLEPMAAIERLREQGAVISAAHPFDSHRTYHWKPDELEALLPYLDAIETFNARCIFSAPNRQAASFARNNGMLEIVGSDAHSLFELGRATMSIPVFRDAASFKAALGHAEKNERCSPAFVHLISRFAVFSKSVKNKFPKR
jgi:predicted metal-dependent phosphoesterase TrpH